MKKRFYWKQGIYFLDSSLEVAFFDALGADINLLGVAMDEDSHFLKVRQELTHGPAADFTSRAAFSLVLAFSRDGFSGEFAFSA